MARGKERRQKGKGSQVRVARKGRKGEEMRDKEKRKEDGNEEDER